MPFRANSPHLLCVHRSDSPGNFLRTNGYAHQFPSSHILPSTNSQFEYIFHRSHSRNEKISDWIDAITTIWVIYNWILILQRRSESKRDSREYAEIAKPSTFRSAKGNWIKVGWWHNSGRDSYYSWKYAPILLLFYAFRWRQHRESLCYESFNNRLRTE